MEVISKAMFSELITRIVFEISVNTQFSFRCSIGIENGMVDNHVSVGHYTLNTLNAHYKEQKQEILDFANKELKKAANEFLLNRKK